VFDSALLQPSLWQERVRDAPAARAQRPRIFRAARSRVRRSQINVRFLRSIIELIATSSHLNNSRQGSTDEQWNTFLNASVARLHANLTHSSPSSQPQPPSPSPLHRVKQIKFWRAWLTMLKHTPYVAMEILMRAITTRTA
jgi:hypothetical protein